MTQRKYLLLMLAPVLAFSSYTHKDGFQLTQSIGASKQKCEGRLKFAEQTQCAAPYQVRFDDYQRERAALLTQRQHKAD